MNLTLLHLSIASQYSIAPHLSSRYDAFSARNFRLTRSFSPLSPIANRISVEHSQFRKCLNSGIALNSVDYEKKVFSLKINGEEKRVNILDSYFVDCHSPRSGGAALLEYDEGIFTVLRCCFERCTSDSEGGALTVLGYTSQVADCSFINCSAVKGAQAFSIGIQASMVSRLVRLTCHGCPRTAPDAAGAVFDCYSGDQFGRDINTTTSNLISGCGCFSSNEATFLNFAYIHCENGHGSCIGLAKSRLDSTTTDPRLTMSTFINNTCEKRELFVSSYALSIEHCVFLHNKVSKVSGSSGEQRPNSKWAMDIKSNDNGVTETNAVYKNCVFDTAEKTSATYVDCQTGATGKPIAISAPAAPRMVRTSPSKKEGKVSMKIVLMGPFFVLATLFAMTNYRASRVKGTILNRPGNFERL